MLYPLIMLRRLILALPVALSTFMMTVSGRVGEQIADYFAYRDTSK